MTTSSPSRRDMVCASIAALAGLACAAPAAAAQAATQPAPATNPAGPFYNIRSFGAVPDAKTLSTAAIQQTIDACTEAGGGIVYVPPGTYLTGTIFLKNNITLYVEAGATLLGSPRIEDYSPQNLLVAKDARNISIAGPGVIDGQSHAFWQRLDAIPKNYEKRAKFAWVPGHQWLHAPKRSGKLVRIEGCSNVQIASVTLANSESWTLHLLGCDDVAVRGIRIRNPLHGPNTDGIDIEACRNVRIADCDIYTGDDAIVIKNRNKDHLRACRNITINNCILTTTCNAIKTGTESFCDFENIAVSNCIIKAGLPEEPLARDSVATIHPEHYGNALAPLGGIAIETVDGANVRGITVSNIVMQGVRAPLFIRLAGRGIHPSKKDQKVPPGTLQDVSISNIVATGASCASSISGIPGHLVRNVSVSNLRVTSIGGGTPEMADIELSESETRYPDPTMWGQMPSHGLFIRHVEGLQLRDLRFACETPDARPALIAHDVSAMRIDGLDIAASPTAARLIDFRDVRDAILRGACQPRGARTWVRVQGAACREIVLLPDSVRGAQMAVERGKDVPADAVVCRATVGG